MRMQFLSVLVLCSLFFVVLESQCRPGINDNELICIGESLSSIPDWLPGAITVLDLSENNIETLDATALRRYPNLQVLNLDQNQIRTSVELRGISELKNLKRLDVSNNFLQTLDLNIFTSNKNLLVIIANNNKHIDITGCNKELPNLRIIALQNSLLTELRLDEFAGCTGLEVLDLSNNKLTSLPKNILLLLPSLKELHITGNPIQDLDASLCELIGNQHPNCVNDISATKTDFSTEKPQGDNSSISVKPLHDSGVTERSNFTTTKTPETLESRQTSDSTTLRDTMPASTPISENEDSLNTKSAFVPIIVILAIVLIIAMPFVIPRSRQWICEQVQPILIEMSLIISRFCQWICRQRNNDNDQAAQVEFEAEPMNAMPQRERN